MISSKEDREIAYNRLYEIAHQEHVNTLKGESDPELETEQNLLIIEVEKFELANSLVCPDCKTPHVRGPGCWECSGLDVNDFK